MLFVILSLEACTNSAPDAVDNVRTTTSSEGSTTAGAVSTTEGRAQLDPTPCREIGPDRVDTVFGPLFVCDRHSDSGPPYGGQVVVRSGVDNAEDAVLAWLAGPTKAEQEAGLQGWDLRPHAWFADSLTLSRDGPAFKMDIGEWRPINNLSTSNGTSIFYISLLGTVFSDPTVEQFELSIMGGSCPVFIGETEWCFPLDWHDFTASMP